MKTQIEIPEGIRFADTQSEINFKEVTSGATPPCLLIIEGEKAAGKSRLAKHLIESLGEKLQVRTILNEKSLEHTFNVEKPRFAFFDEVRTPNSRLNSAAMVGAVENGVLVILAGETVELTPNLEKHAVRVRLGHA